MRPEAIRKALLEAENRRTVVHLNDGSRLRVRSREHWLVSPEYLYIVVGQEVHRAAFRNVTSIVPSETRSRQPSKKRRRTG